MRQYIFLLATIALLANADNCYSQQKKLIENDSLLKVYLSGDQFDLDTAAHAVVLTDKATADITVKNPGRYFYQRLRYTLEKCIKIKDVQALAMAEIAIPYTADMKVKDISVISVQLTDGQVIKTKMTRGDLIKEKITGDLKVYKLNLPDIKPGSIIYYTYTYQTDFEGSFQNSFYLPLSWTFQNKYPTLESVFELKIPMEINYKAIVKNVHFDNLNSVAALEQSEHAKLITVEKEESGSGEERRYHIVWKRNNIKDNRDVEFIRDPDSKTEKLIVYVASYFLNPYVKFTLPIFSTWKEANHLLFYDQKNIGGWVFKPADTLSFILNKITHNETNNLVMAKTIYKYVRDSIECTGYSQRNRVWACCSPRATFNQKKGSISDKNILLAALLRKAGLKTYPVVLATSGGEKLSEEYFEPDALNYLVTLLVIDSNYYYLDASSRELPFGVLKPKCYNGFAWVVSEEGTQVNLNPNELMDKNSCMATLKPTKTKGLYSLKMEQRLGNVSGPLIRTAWLADSVKSKEVFLRDIQNMNYKSKVISCSFANIHNPDTTVTVSYNLEIELEESGNFIYLNPFFKRLAEHNPFKDIPRKYPVELPSAENIQFILKFTLPEGYTLEDLEETANMSFNNGAMKYTRSMFYDPGARVFSLNSALQCSTAEVSPEDYKELRSFYEAIVSDQSKSITMKKVN